MFQSEHLQEKWSPLLDYDGLDPIKDNHRRAMLPLSCSRTKRNSSVRSSPLSGYQPDGAPLTLSGSISAGFSGSAYRWWPSPGFDPVLISLIRRSMPNLVAYDLAGVQPMNGPTGLIFAMRSVTRASLVPRASTTKSIPHSPVKTLDSI